MGFPMRCDANTQGVVTDSNTVTFNPLWVFQCAATFAHFHVCGIPASTFNPLWVFQCAATFCSVLLQYTNTLSIPYGFSNALRHKTKSEVLTSMLAFNPLWVFQCAATIQPLSVPYPSFTSFQSLMGFPMRCDNNKQPLKKEAYDSFQSLMGFPMRCDEKISAHLRTSSVPLSIPYGFSNALRLDIMLYCETPSGSFQSLMGFPMRCDLGDDIVRKAYAYFQSLMGFPMRCDAGSDLSVRLTPSVFQSLMGFPMRCDQTTSWSPRNSHCTFNPLWVFQCAATAFQSPEGLEVGDLSIPYGFSNALRLPQTVAML